MGFFNSLVNNVVDAGKKLMDKGNKDGQINLGGSELGMGNQASTFNNIQAANSMNTNATQNNVTGVNPSMLTQPEAQMQNVSSIPEMPPMQNTAGTTSGGYSQPEQNSYGINQGMMGTPQPTINPFDGGNTNPVPPIQNGIVDSYNPNMVQNPSMNPMQNSMDSQNANFMTQPDMMNQNSNPMPGMNRSPMQDVNPMQNSQMTMPDMQKANVNVAQVQDFSQNAPMPNDGTEIQQGPKPAFFVPQNENPVPMVDTPQVPTEPMNQPDTNIQQPMGQMNPMPGIDTQNAQTTTTYINNQPEPQISTSNNFMDTSQQTNFDSTSATDNSTNNWGA